MAFAIHAQVGDRVRTVRARKHNDKTGTVEGLQDNGRFVGPCLRRIDPILTVERLNRVTVRLLGAKSPTQSGSTEDVLNLLPVNLEHARADEDEVKRASGLKTLRGSHIMYARHVTSRHAMPRRAAPRHATSYHLTLSHVMHAHCARMHACRRECMCACVYSTRSTARHGNAGPS